MNRIYRLVWNATQQAWVCRRRVLPNT
ncbi:ESPR-type extended signal peptide-containing protein [Escherichia coli]|nr:ESPR-type extended signal peptide-containing protein [Escherichia coli]MCQ7033483.1 ESPR domain-containing protein [Escherichia coli]